MQAHWGTWVAPKSQRMSINHFLGCENAIHIGKQLAHRWTFDYACLCKDSQQDNVMSSSLTKPLISVICSNWYDPLGLLSEDLAFWLALNFMIALLQSTGF